jgi:hypothetical protein
MAKTQTRFYTFSRGKIHKKKSLKKKKKSGGTNGQNEACVLSTGRI